MIQKINESRNSLFTLLLLIFFFMMILNVLTPYCVDDYAYMYSFADGSKITNVFDIFPSMYQHAFTMNGRLVAHFFAQLFLMLPKFYFNFLNSGIFTLQIYMIYKYCIINKKENNAFLLLIIFMMVCLFVPDFGQVYLWLDGACNYLWAITLALVYLYPIFAIIYRKNILNNWWKKSIYIVVGLLSGAYLESISLGIIITFVFLLLYNRFIQKFKIEKWMYISLACLIIGYLFMMNCPATWSNKAASGGINIYIQNFINILVIYKEILVWPCILWVCAFIIGCYLKMNKIVLFTSSLFMVISLMLNFMHITAFAYPHRSMIGCAIFLILALNILISEIFVTKYQVFVVLIGVIIIMFAFVDLVVGSYDILSVYQRFNIREKYISEQKALGNYDLELDWLEPETKYSAYYGLRDLSTEERETWPNTAISRYYGVNSIIGIREKKD